MRPEHALRSELSPYPPYRRKWRYRVGLLYPNRYSVGMSNLGFQSLLMFLSEIPEIFPQRFFTDIDGSLESGDSLSQMDVILISASYELDFLNAIRMLNRLPKSSPPIIVGGAAPTLSPIPPLAFAHFIFRGDAQGLLSNFTAFLRGGTETGEGLPLRYIITKEHLSAEICHLPHPPAYSPIISSYAHLRNMFLIEIQHSCPFRCPFCATPYIYGKFENYPAEEILKTIDEHNPGTKRIGLVGSAISEHPEIENIVSRLVTKGYSVHTSSLRADRISNKLIKLFARAGVREMTLAPETHIEHLYPLVGKHINPDKIIEVGLKLKESGILAMKLYYIIGLPGETDDDVVALADNIDYIAKQLTGLDLSISINPFIPKKGALLSDKPMLSHKKLTTRFSLLKLRLEQSPVRLAINYNIRTRAEMVLSTMPEAGYNLLDGIMRGFSLKKALSIIERQ